MTMDKHSRVSRPAVTPYKKPYRPLMSKEERDRQKASFRRYKVDGGGDIA